MLIERKSRKLILLKLLKDFSSTHTVTSLAEHLKISRIAVWKHLSELDKKQFITLKPIGKGKTNIAIAHLNWDNILVSKILAVYLTDEAVQQRRWRFNFEVLEEYADFVLIYGSILHSPKTANDIDLLAVGNKRKLLTMDKAVESIQRTIDKNIHFLSFTPQEFRRELKKPNKAFVDALKKGVILFGQENFISFVENEL